MDMNIKDQLRMARGQTRSNRKLTVTPLRCCDRRLAHRPFGADSLDGLWNAECGMAFVPNSAFFFLLRLRQRNESSSGFQMRVRDGEPHSTGGGSDPAHSIAPITQAPGRYSVLTRTT